MTNLQNLDQLLFAYDQREDRATEMNRQERKARGLDPDPTIKELFDDLIDDDTDDSIDKSGSVVAEEQGETLQEILAVVAKHPDAAIQKIQLSIHSEDILQALKDLVEEREDLCSDNVHQKIAEALSDD